MRIALALHSLDPALGGVTSATIELARALTARANTVTLFTFDEPHAPFLKDIHVPVVALGEGSKKGYGFVKDLSVKLSAYEKSFDAIVLNGLWLYSTSGMATWARKNKIPYFVFPHGMLDPYFARAYPLKHLKKLLYWLYIERATLCHAAAVCYATSSEQALAQKTFPAFHPRRQEVIGLGLRSFEGDLSAARESFLNAFPTLRGQPYLLYLSRFHPKKAPDLLLQAFNDAAKQETKWQLVMAGPEEMSDYYKNLRALSNDNPKILWTGMLTGEKKWGALATAEAVILPSHQENFGMVIAEALSVGTPALVSRQVALSEDILADHCGAVEGDTQEGTKKLLENFLKLSTAEKENMRSNALACYKKRYMPAAVAERLEKLIKEVA